MECEGLPPRWQDSVPKDGDVWMHQLHLAILKYVASQHLIRYRSFILWAERWRLSKKPKIAAYPKWEKGVICNRVGWWLPASNPQSLNVTVSWSSLICLMGCSNICISMVSSTHVFSSYLCYCLFPVTVCLSTTICPVCGTLIFLLFFKSPHCHFGLIQS